MPRWNPPRWSLGASALVALVAAGCGGTSGQPEPALHATAEKRLLSLVARARVDATKQDGTAVHAVLGEFVAEVQTLKTSGQLTGLTAGQLDSEARTTGAQATQQLHPAKVANARPNAATQTTTTPAAANPTAPATGADPNPATTTSANHPPSPAANAAQQNGQGTDGADSPRPGRGHGYGRRLGGDGPGRWSAVRNWINANFGGGGGGD